MARVKRGFKARRRRNKVLKMAKGFHFDRRTKYRHAVQTVERALHYAFINSLEEMVPGSEESIYEDEYALHFAVRDFFNERA